MQSWKCCPSSKGKEKKEALRRSVKGVPWLQTGQMESSLYVSLWSSFEFLMVFLEGIAVIVPTC